MKTYTTKELNANVFAYILDAIDNPDSDIIMTTEEKLQFLSDQFKDAYVFSDNLKRYGNYQTLFKEWIMGLPSCFNIDYTNYDIIRIAKLWKSIPENATDKQEEKIINNYFNFIAAKTMQLFSKHKINSFYL